MNLRLLWIIALTALTAAAIPFCLKNLETTKWYTDISLSSGHTPESAKKVAEAFARKKEKGLHGYETTLFGWTIDAEYDWGDVYPTRHPGLPGGKYGLIALIILLGVIFLLFPAWYDWLVNRKRMKSVEL